MTNFLIVGNEPCTIPKILEIIKSVDGLRCLNSCWENVAALFGVQKTELSSCDRDMESLWFEILHTWTEKKGDFATLGVFCTALSVYDKKHVKEKLDTEFAKILSDRILSEDGVFHHGNFIRMRDIFGLPAWMTTHPKKNDPTLILRHSLKIPNKLVCRDWMAKTFDKFIKELNKNQFELVEKFCFMRLSLYSLARTMGVTRLENENEARKLLSKLNLTNFGMCFFYWFIVAKSVIEFTMKERQQRQQRLSAGLVLEKVFDIVDEYKDDDNLSLKFKNSVLVFFIDWMMGLEDETRAKLYDLKFNVEDPSLVQYAIASVKYNAVNLMQHISRYHSFLHKVLQNTMWFGRSDLAMRKKIVLQIISENPNSVYTRDESNSPVLRKRYVHVQLLKLVIEKGANVEELDRRGRNFLHILVQHYPAEQFYELLHFLLERNQIHLLNARDVFQQTPLILAPQLVLSVHNACMIALFASFGVDFNVNDRYGQSFLYYGVRWNKCVGVLQALVEYGASWRWRGSDNKSLLHVAAEEGNLGAMKYLVGLGLNISARDENGNSPLDLAITSYAPSRVEVIKFLLQQW